MAKSTTVDTVGALLDWRQDVTVRDLKAKRDALQAEMTAVEGELVGRKRRESEAPSVLVRLYERVFNQEIPEGEVTRFLEEGPARTQAIARAEGRLLSLRPQLAALDAAISAAETSAQHASAKTLQEAYQAEAAVLLKAYEGLAASSTRMHQLYQQALAQFPLVAVYRAPKPYAADIKHAAGLEPLYDEDAIRAQRGTAGYLPAAPWDRAVYGGRFKQVWDGLRNFLGLEVDKGEMTPEGAEALKVHQAQGRADRTQREAAMHAAIKAARERGEILPAYLRAS
jgi:hypothetical protein